MQPGQVLPESTIEWFDLSRECLALVIQSWEDQILIAFEPDPWRQDPRTCAFFKSLVYKLGSGEVGPFDSYQNRCSLNKHCEDSASLVLQIAEITSFVELTPMLQRQKNLVNSKKL